MVSQVRHSEISIKRQLCKIILKKIQITHVIFCMNKQCFEQQITKGNPHLNTAEEYLLLNAMVRLTAAVSCLQCISNIIF